MNFNTFTIKKNSWWKHKSFNIYNSKKEIAFKVTNKTDDLQSASNFENLLTGDIYMINKPVGLNSNFIVLKNNESLASLSLSSKQDSFQLFVNTTISEAFTVTAHLFDADYTIERNNISIAKIVFKMWPKFSYSIEINDQENNSLIIASILILESFKNQS